MSLISGSVLALLLLSSCLWIKRYRSRHSNAIKRWLQHYDIKRHQQYFNTIYHDIDGFTLSRAARLTENAPQYCYGEIEYIPFLALLSLCSVTPDTILYDLGSGTGKAIISAAMIYPMQRYIGIEYFAPLCAAAQKATQRLRQYPDHKDRAQHIQWIHSSIEEADFSDGTLIFINAVTFRGALWEYINQQCALLQTGATVITTSKPLYMTGFTLQKKTHIMMSWGTVAVFIQQKTHATLTCNPRPQHDAPCMLPELYKN